MRMATMLFYIATISYLIFGQHQYFERKTRSRGRQQVTNSYLILNTPIFWRKISRTKRDTREEERKTPHPLIISKLES